MLPKLPLDAPATVTFRKYTANGRDVTHLGAFPTGEIIRFVVTCSRTLGASAVVLRLNRDGCTASDTPFEFVSEDMTTLTDTYELTLDTAALCAFLFNFADNFIAVFIAVVKTAQNDGVDVSAN